MMDYNGLHETWAAADRLYDEGRYYLAKSMFEECLNLTNDPSQRSRIRQMMDMCDSAAEFKRRNG